MKKLWNILLSFVAVTLVAACGFDDSGLQDRLSEIQERIAALQSRIDDTNAQIESLGLLTSGNVVTSVAQNSDGSYVLNYLDSKGEEKTMVVAATNQMINVPTMGVRKGNDGLFYWTVTTRGETVDFTIDGNVVPVAGKTPVISVDNQGYWTADGVRILDANGNAVEASDGSSSVFKAVAKDGDGNLSVTLGNGTSFTIPVQNSLNLTISTAVKLGVANTSFTVTVGYELTGSSAESAIVALADVNGVNAVLNKEEKKVEVTFEPDFLYGHIILMATDLDKATVLRPVFFEKTKETTIHIASASDLVTFAQRVNAQDGAELMTVYLDNDIDMSSVADWTPVGNGTFNGTVVSGPAFKGIFDGQGHLVKGLKMNLASGAATGSVCGLFGVLSGAEVNRVIIGEGSSLTAASTKFSCAGSVAGAVVNSTIDGCVSYAEVKVSGGADNVSVRVGGIAGSMICDNAESHARIDNCYNYGKITSTNTVNTKNGATAFSIGGVLGFMESAIAENHATMQFCQNSGSMDVQASRHGGVVATMNKNATALGCTNLAELRNSDVKASNTRVAGIVSAMGTNTSVINCVNRGNVFFTVAGNISQGYAAGIVGQTNDNNGNNIIEGCENYGSIRSDIFNNTDAAKRFIGIIVANTNQKAISITGNKVGGKIGPYSDASAVVDITADNFNSYIYFTPGKAPSKVENNVFAGEVVKKGIASAEDLVAFAAAVNSGSSTAQWEDEVGGINLLNDIDMSSVADWTPIGNGTYVVSSNVLSLTGPKFTGKFNGQGYKFKNFRMAANVETTGGTYGLFGIIGPGAVVENFTFDATCSLTVTSTGPTATHGLIAGLVYDGTVRDVHSYAPMTFKGKSANNKAQFMALIGYIFASNNDVIVDSVDNYGEIVAENLAGNDQSGATSIHIGGIVGFSTTTVDTQHFITISDSSNEGNITSGACRTSGICTACNRRTKLVNCVNKGNQLNNCPGPDKGRLGNITCLVANESSLTGCVNYGDIVSTTSARTAGIANLTNNCVFTGCANYGKVQTDSQYRGLFWAYNNGAASWSNCTAGGTVGTYNNGSGVDDSYTEDTKATYLGIQGGTKTTLTDITYLIGVKEPDKPSESNAKLKVLFIGNSFTKDAVEHIPGMLAAAGIKDIKLYHMYYGGRRVYEYNDGYSSVADYHCYQCENGASTWTDVTGHSLHEIVSSDKWDIVTIQEHTGRAVAWDWTESQKAAFEGLVSKIKADCPDKTPDFYFIMSQAYQDLGKIASADRGNVTFSNTAEMYDVIVSMTKKLMADIPFKDVIATGTYLQNMRTSVLNNSMDLSRDGYHMDYGIARYGAACMIFEKLISPSFDNILLDGNSYRYSNSSTTMGSYSTPVTDANAPVALKAARYALEKPYEITNMLDVPVNGVADIPFDNGTKE